jgi:hypothetical protein
MNRYGKIQKLSYMRRGPTASIKPFDLSKPSVAASFPRGFSLNCGVCFALGEGFLHHGPSNRAVLLGKGLPHALHGDMRRLTSVSADANDNQGELKKVTLRRL